MGYDTSALRSATGRVASAIAAMLSFLATASAEPVDPRFPAELRAGPDSPAPARRLSARIRQLEDEREQLLQKISVLPQHDPKFMADHLGFHSLFDDPGSAGNLPLHRLLFKANRPLEIGAIALAPAFNPLEYGGNPYAFPRRFRIEVLEEGAEAFVTVVDWMQEDFPDPGPYPVFFSDINRIAREIRITVAKDVQQSGAAYYALGEVYLFRQTADARVGANMATWGDDSLTVMASDSFGMKPLWSLEYLNDGAAGFGFPLSDATVESDDLLVTFKEGEPAGGQVQVILDLGKVKPIGRIHFWPAEAPHLLALPSFGFPQKVLVELSAGPGFNRPKKIVSKNVGDRMFRDNLFSVVGTSYNARFVRITMEGFPEYRGQRILGLGEILVSQNEYIHSIGCKITANGLPKEALEQLPRLVDGCSRHRRIMSQGEWIRGLAKRRPLDRRLAAVEQELAVARARLRRVQLQWSIWIGGLLCLGLLCAMVLQRLQRRRVLGQLKWRITRDLHDEVGSSLGSIALTTEQLEHLAPPGEMKEELTDLSLMAREACASLREVVWVIDQKTIRLPALLHKLVERAERVLGRTGLAVDLPQDCPNLVVSLTAKRHLIMFFKEVVHNCARHAHATLAQLSVTASDGQLRISVADNGCGFDPVSVSDGWGLASMRQRAEELGGAMKLRSHPGEGTTVELEIPLDALRNEPRRAYKTSN
ncbi:sensor histidine kinase [Pontiella sp.]|uniref:sensor histidine kinase n=1 Tax=Pontiella sp. TaxID=2837462 RepID=UPI0035677E87